ncbi:hypothetical protein OKA05_00615 [Luteolibacter arcticus]|uniref:Uncharacterized protein n=1 Tax=Luteolibacter arcticus TaxID=1581411 RepID=A0ABT3GBT3_9BACT|nr:hypothetical protein [Luteolibacter arcticus]MCW1921034.1 hypothetical protein [Luteolibacter arcticus]
MRLHLSYLLVLLCLGSACKKLPGIASEQDVRSFFSELGSKDEEVILLESRDLYSRSDGSSRSMFIGRMHKLLRSNPKLREELEKSNHDTDREMHKDIQAMGSGLEAEWE